MDAAAQPILRALIPWATTELAATPASELFSLEIAPPAPEIVNDLPEQAKCSPDSAAQVTDPSLLISTLVQPRIPFLSEPLPAMPAAEQAGPASSERIATQKSALPLAVAAVLPADGLDQAAGPHAIIGEKTEEPSVSQPEAQGAAKQIDSAVLSEDISSGAQPDLPSRSGEPSGEREAEVALPLPSPKSEVGVVAELHPEDSSDAPVVSRPLRDAPEQAPAAAVKPADTTHGTPAPPGVVPSENEPPVSSIATAAPLQIAVPMPQLRTHTAAPVREARQLQAERLDAPSLDAATPRPESSGLILRAAQATEPVHVSPDRASNPPMALAGYAVSVQAVPIAETTGDSLSPDTFQPAQTTASVPASADSPAALRPPKQIPHVEIPHESEPVAQSESVDALTNTVAEPRTDAQGATEAENISENSEKVEVNREASTNNPFKPEPPADHALEPVPVHEAFARHGHAQAAHPTGAPIDRPGSDPRLGQQLVANLPQAADRPVEITLAPEELGRVRLTLSLSEGGPHLVVQADRPETLELMRRHVDQLAQDFRDMGFEGMGFAFSQHPAGSQGDAKADFDGQSAVSDAPLEIASPLTSAPDPIPGRGLDLRL